MTTSTQPLRVLIVDDEADTVDSIRDLLQSQVDGVEVVTANSGAEALESLPKQRVDLIVSDYRMPGMNGLDFLVRARAVAPKARRALMTAYPDVNVAISAVNDAAVTALFLKPLQPQALVTLASETQSRRKAAGERARAIARELDDLARRGLPKKGVWAADPARDERRPPRPPTHSS